MMDGGAWDTDATDDTAIAPVPVEAKQDGAAAPGPAQAEPDDWAAALAVWATAPGPAQAEQDDRDTEVDGTASGPAQEGQDAGTKGDGSGRFLDDGDSGPQ